MATEIEKSQRGTKKQLLFVTWLTCIRAPIIILFMLGVLLDILFPVTINKIPFFRYFCLVLMIISSFTDLFDGLLARKWHVTSKFGAICDPLMDKVFFVVVFPTVTSMLFISGDIIQGSLMLFFTVFYILRDLWVVTLRSLAVGKADMRANFVGKLRTFLGFPTGMLVYAHVALEWPWLTKEVMIAIEVFGIILNLYSLYAYTKRYGFAIIDAMNSEK